MGAQRIRQPQIRIIVQVIHQQESDNPNTKVIMKSLILAVILSVLVISDAQPSLAKAEMVDAVDPVVIARVMDCLNGYHMRPPMKRNSELLNSLLGLPQNILRSGK